MVEKEKKRSWNVLILKSKKITLKFDILAQRLYNAFFFFLFFLSHFPPIFKKILFIKNVTMDKN